MSMLPSRCRKLLPAAAAVGLSAVLLASAGAGLNAARAQGAPAVDGDEALRCAVQRAVDMAGLRQLHDIVAGDGATLALLRDMAGGKTDVQDSRHLTVLTALGLVAPDKGGLTDLGRRIAEFGTGGSASQVSVVLTLDDPRTMTVAQPGALAYLRLDTTGSGGQTIVIEVTPQAGGGDACAEFEPVVRAGLPGMPGMEAVARAGGPDRSARLYLHNVAEGDQVAFTVADVVGAPGSFTVRASSLPSPALGPVDAMAVLAVSDGPLAYTAIETAGERAVVAFSIEEGYETPVLTVRGLAGAQPGVTVHAADAFGDVSDTVVYRSSHVPTPDAAVDLGGFLGPGIYAATIEELGGRPATFLLAYSTSSSGAAFRVGSELEIGTETPQVLGSDLAFTVDEAGWYAFTTWSYDEVDPVMSLLDGEGTTLYHSDDAAFGLHPLIVAELAPGAYSLAVDGFDGATGDLTLGAWRFEPQVLELGTVALEQQVANDLSQPNFMAYLVPVTANELVDIDVEGLVGDFDSTLALYDSADMSVWNADDDGGVGYGSRIIDSLDGRSLLAVVSSYDGSRGGAFSISAVDHASMENLEASAVAVQPGGAPALGHLASESDIAWFRIDPMEGSHTLTVQSDAMPYLSIDLYTQVADGFTWLDSTEGYEGITELPIEGDPRHALFVLVRNPGGEGIGDLQVSLD